MTCAAQSVFAFLQACKCDFEALLAADRGPQSAFTFHKACRDGRLEDVIALLADSGLDARVNFGHAMMLAAGQGHVHVVQILLADKRVDPRTQAGDAIKWARRLGKLEVVKAFVEDGRADPRFFTETDGCWYTCAK